MTGVRTQNQVSASSARATEDDFAAATGRIAIGTNVAHAFPRSRAARTRVRQETISSRALHELSQDMRGPYS